jgi:hypothetical protein
MRSFSIFAALTAWFASLVVSSPVTALAAAPPFTPDALASAEYVLPEIGRVRLAAGAFDDPEHHLHVTLIDSPRLFADLTGDDRLDAVVHLAVNTGGSGAFSYAALVVNADGAPRPVTAAPIGDRIILRSFTAARDGTLTARYLERRPDQPMVAKPTVAAARLFRWNADRPVAAGPLSINDVQYALYPLDGTHDTTAFFGAGVFAVEDTDTSARLLRTPRAAGDLDGDGAPDTVVVVEASNETGLRLTLLYPVMNRVYTASPQAFASLGDRVRITKLAVTGGAVEVDFIDAGRVAHHRSLIVADGRLVDRP